MGNARIRPLSVLIGAGVGAAVAYFFDPVRGRSRRIQAAEQLAATGRDLLRQTSRQGSRALSDLQGQADRLGQQAAVQTERLATQDDVTVAKRVESQIFRDRSLPSGAVSVNAEDGVIVLRGELDSEEQIRRVEAAAREVAGVRGIQNLLHLSGTPAPNTAEPRRVGA
jgi:osmotically-inducible protein OsmY